MQVVSFTKEDPPAFELADVWLIMAKNSLSLATYSGLCSPIGKSETIYNILRLRSAARLSASGSFTSAAMPTDSSLADEARL